ncbi:MAG: NifU family protein [Planctomycetota bacterium]|nr:MAG: NifU family protein [Planctomycetota bacterium]
MAKTDPSADTSADLSSRVAEVLELIRPAIRSDGGDVELVSVDDAGRVRIRFLGACVGCPSSTMTLRYGIEDNLKRLVPEVAEVIAEAG